MKCGALGLLLLGLGHAALAVDSGSSVVVIYNSSLPDSRAVAAHYAAMRHVPFDRIIGFELPSTETMTRAEYRDQLQRPLLKFLQHEHLFVYQPGAGPDDATTNNWRLIEARVRYAVLCYGVPLRILEDPNLAEPNAEKIIPELRRNGAAVDSELSILPCASPKFPLTGPLRNPYYGTTNAALLDPTNGILMVARLDGPTVNIARGLVDKAIQAETDGLWGRGYFDLRGLTNTAYKEGDDWIRGAAEITRLFGYETMVDDKPGTFPTNFPMSQIAFYAGWYDARVSGPFTQSHVEFMPGAFAYHLHSYSAQTLRSTNQNWCGPLLAEGVTATMGCVDEPLLDGTPNMDFFFGRWLLLGFSFGEAAYAAEPALSWQTTVVGDPLYRPFAKNPQTLHEELVRRHSKLIEWSHLRVVDLDLVKGFDIPELIQYLKDQKVTRQSAVLTEKLGDLYKQEGKRETALAAYKQALKLDPTPQQAREISVKTKSLH